MHKLYELYLLSLIGNTGTSQGRSYRLTSSSRLDGEPLDKVGVTKPPYYLEKTTK